MGFLCKIGVTSAPVRSVPIDRRGPNGSPVLAPLYDTLSTAVCPTLTQKMAMKLGSKYKFSEVQARYWEQFAEGVGFTKAQAKRRTLELTKLLPATARKLQSDPRHRFSGNAVVEQINTLIEQRCTLTIRRLADLAPACFVPT